MNLPCCKQLVSTFSEGSVLFLVLPCADTGTASNAPEASGDHDVVGSLNGAALFNLIGSSAPLRGPVAPNLA